MVDLFSVALTQKGCHMKSPVLKCLALLAAALLTNHASAESFSARIQSILLYEDGDIAYVYPVGGVVNPPACHGSNGNYVSFKLNRPRAKEYLAALLVAHASGKTVIFYTASACIDQSVSDTLRYFSIEN
jgi:hypothetical protein